ncbi:MAG TPA: hypothetical protein VM364_02195 [Vicinamibacterales bacterium]|nr:hypothetical protein [Vicinamibacterales bacterium]
MDNSIALREIRFLLSDGSVIHQVTEESRIVSIRTQNHDISTRVGFDVMKKGDALADLLGCAPPDWPASTEVRGTRE